MTINILTTGMDLTDSIKGYIEDKFGSLKKYFDSIIQIDVEVGRSTNHHHKGDVFFAKANLNVPNHPQIYIKKEEDDLYKAIDKVQDHFKDELDRVKGKMRTKDRDGIRDEKAYDL